MNNDCSKNSASNDNKSKVNTSKINNVNKHHSNAQQTSITLPLFVGFMLLSFFFGAGNLIFPPMLGMEAGSNFVPAITGFLLTAIALPLLSVMVVATAQGGLLGIGHRVHPIFAYVYAILVYLSIGVMYGIPRAANVGYEMGFHQFVNLPDRLSLVIYVLLFFSVCYFLSIKSSRLVDIIGKYLTPILLAVITLLCGLAIFNLESGSQAAIGKFADNPFSAGIIEGYFTLDALAGLAFGTVLSASIVEVTRSKAAQSASQHPNHAGKAETGLASDNQTHSIDSKATQVHDSHQPDSQAKANSDKRYLAKVMMQSSLVAGTFLGLIYLSLAWVGLGMYRSEGYENGAVLLSNAATLLMGQAGNFTFGIIVILACLTTCIGLINACASFARQLFPRVSYQKYVLLFSLAGAVFSNLGLELILSIAVPIMMFIYPISIALVVLSVLHRFIAHRPLTYVFGVGVVTLYACYDTLSNLVESPLLPHSVIEKLPLGDIGLGWIVPMLVMAIIGYFVKRVERGLV